MKRERAFRENEEIAYLGDTALHNQEVWIVDVELDALEDSSDSLLCGLVAIQDVLRVVRDSNL